MTRGEIIDQLESRGCTLSGGFAFRTDQEVEQVHAAWLARHSHKNVCITMSQQPGGKIVISFTALEV